MKQSSLLPVVLRRFMALVLMLMLSSVLAQAGHAAIVTVTNTADSGPGTLRAAIIAANALPNTRIVFNIPAAAAQDGVFTIQVKSALPTISANGTIVDGGSQTAFGGNTNRLGPEIVLQPDPSASPSPTATATPTPTPTPTATPPLPQSTTLATPSPTFTPTPTPTPSAPSSVSSGLIIEAARCVVRNLVIGGFAYAGIVISGRNARANRIEGCYIGVAADGQNTLGNQLHGIQLTKGTAFNTIGGITPEARNVISGNRSAGIYLETPNNSIQGNFIGADATGMKAVPNYRGILVIGHSNTIGGSAPETRNVISGNSYSGITIYTSFNRVQNNFIGVNARGTNALANIVGIIVEDGSSNIIGASALDPNPVRSGNYIAFNQSLGVFIGRPGVTVRGNQIRFNGQLGIHYFPSPANFDYYAPIANDLNETTNPTVPNHPVIVSSQQVGNSVIMNGALNSAPRRTFLLDFYSSRVPDRSGFGEGEEYVGSTRVTTDANGDAAFRLVLSGSFLGRFITATATNLSTLSTSEFGPAVLVSSTLPPPVAPIITAFSPGIGAEGTEVILAGFNFGGATRVAFNGRPAEFQLLSPTRIRATVPQRSSTGRISVTTPRGTAFSPGIFEVRDTNDFFQFARLLEGPNGTVEDSNERATSEPGEPIHAGVGGGKSLWYRWTAPADGTATFNTSESYVDTVLAIYTGSTLRDLRLVAANDDLGGESYPIRMNSLVTFSVTEGTTYFIAVDGYSSGTYISYGAFRLNWQFTPAPVATPTPTVTPTPQATIAPEPTAVPVTAGGAALRVSAISAQRARQTVQIRFATALDADSAADAARYAVTVNGQNVEIESASYQTATFTVVLGLPAGTLRAGDDVIVTWRDLHDARGRSYGGSSRARAS